MKTAVSAPAPAPSPDEMLKAIANMTLAELMDFKAKLEKLIDDKERCPKCLFRWRYHGPNCS